MGDKGGSGRGRDGERGVFFDRFHLDSSMLAKPRRHIEVMWWDLDLYSGATLVKEPKWSFFISLVEKRLSVCTISLGCVGVRY